MSGTMHAPSARQQGDAAPQATVIITPRDRYTGLDECVEVLLANTPEPIEIWVLDLDYPQALIEPARRRLAGHPGARFFSLGLVTPMDALRTVRGEFVFVANGGWYLRTPVQTGAAAGGWVEIRDGLYEGDTVVAQGSRALWLAEIQAVNGGVSCTHGH